MSIRITSESTVFEAITLVNHLIQGASFDDADKQCIFITVSELARNVLNHADAEGFMTFAMVNDGLRVTCADKGKGIQQLPDILQGTYQSSNGLGAGLSSVKRLMDKLDINTSSEGTEIVAFKRERRSR